MAGRSRSKRTPLGHLWGFMTSRKVTVVLLLGIAVLLGLGLWLPQEPGDLFKRLLQMNRDLVHGAFVLDEDAKLILFRDTLQMENLDRNELEGSIRALSLALAEYSSELLSYAKK